MLVKNRSFKAENYFQNVKPQQKFKLQLGLKTREKWQNSKIHCLYLKNMQS